MATPDQGLFSLVEAATIASPIPTAREPSVDSTLGASSYKGASSLGAGTTSAMSSTKVHAAMKHRRLSSTGQTRRRLSEAREASSRPSSVVVQTTAAALSSLATLSLSGSPPPQGLPQTGTSFTSASGILASRPTATVPKLEAKDDDIVIQEASVVPPAKPDMNIAGGGVTKAGKKRGTIFKCESCSKVYRHPSCLIKHRWEHSPHWREASKFLLSKHQQVQLLEAAAILSHLAPSASGGTSLPEDRSLWPSFLSGGLLPPPDQANLIHGDQSKARAASVSNHLDNAITHPMSSSVPARSLLSSSVGTPSPSNHGSGTPTSAGRSSSTGPRMHDYAIPTSGGVTQVRPGVVGVPTHLHPHSQPDVPAVQAAGSLNGTNGMSPNNSVFSANHRSAPVPVSDPIPVSRRDAYREPASADGGAYSFVSAASVSDAWSSSPISVGFAQSSFRSSVGSASAVSASLSASASGGFARSFSDSGVGGSGSGGGWSLPRSSLRSVSRSRSRSGSVEMEMDDDRVGVDARRVEGEGEYVDVDGMGVGDGVHVGRFGFTSRGWRNEKIEEEEWDGMEMEMEM